MLRLFTIAVIVFGVLSSAAVRAENLTIAVNTNNAPFSWLDGKIARGIDVDIVREVAERAGHVVQFVVLPWKRVLNSVETGAVDGGTPAFYRTEREIFARYMKVPFRFAQFSAFVGKESNLTYESPASLKGLTVGKLLGYAVGPKFDEVVKKKDLDIVEVMGVEQALHMLRLGRIDVFINNSVVTKYRAKQLNINEQFSMLTPPVNPGEGVFLIFSKAKFGSKETRFFDKFDEALQSAIDDGTIEAIFNHYTQ